METRISSTTTVRGRVSGKDDLLVDGRVEGDVYIDGELIIHSEARIDGNIEANQVEINGCVKGNVSASASLSITKSARVQGDLLAPTIIIADGALVKGNVDIGGVKGGPEKRSTKKNKEGATVSDEPKLPEGTVARKVRVKS